MEFVMKTFLGLMLVLYLATFAVACPPNVSVQSLLSYSAPVAVSVQSCVAPVLVQSAPVLVQSYSVPAAVSVQAVPVIVQQQAQAYSILSAPLVIQSTPVVFNQKRVVIQAQNHHSAVVVQAQNHHNAVVVQAQNHHNAVVIQSRRNDIFSRSQRNNVIRSRSVVRSR